ncbi:SCP2 sterol-binding domain-containing protein [Streptomyces sp. Go40/10]|uniref:SCP2 sterol-binding domain-containing protein n=1 Tax=Streptomyces sp. Go40/10 TaxID=2825844 RepID=UPI001E3A7D95|nr:SCP2 sterol-binding domain-containing protein [Streptomyces sp. Go40/10]UFR01383.1 SCP2 sterol-binding domain-containing protein [Streptomyces sp. Go40/10]
MTDVDTGYARLATLIRATPDSGLHAALAAGPGGLDTALDTVFAHMASLVDPDRVKGEKGVFQYEITTDEGVKSRWLRVENDTCVAGRGTDDGADITIGIRLADLARLATGQLSGQRAFVTGRMKLKGNAMFGLKLGQWFRRD